MRVESGVVLERESALASLREYAASARRGGGRLVLISGEAGVGKSTVVEQLRRELTDAEWAVGVCDGVSTPQPLGPLFELADQLGGDLADLCRAGGEREELFRALLRQIGPQQILTVVVVEDIHWADDATLDVLRYLGRRLRDAAALIIATYRDDALAADDPLRVALGDLAAQRWTRRIGLAPLSAQAVGVLAAGSGLAADELHRLTGGNPFYLTEMLQSGTVGVPASARDVVLARVAALSPDARAGLDVAALTGGRVDLRLLDAAAGTAAGADELVTAGLLLGDGPGLRFRHEIARMAVAEAVPAHRAPAIHARVLAALLSFGCRDEARLAFHAEAAGDADAVLRHAPAAAQQAARLASHREAAAQFERALRFAADADLATLAALHQGYADEAALLDRWDDADRATQQALDCWRRAGLRTQEGDALRRLSRIRWNLCQGAEAVQAIEAAVATLEPLGPSIPLAWAYATSANQRMLYSDHENAITLARRAQALAAEFDATEVLSEALDTEAASASVLNREWEPQLRRALDIALAGGHHSAAARAYTNLCGIHGDQRELGALQQYLAEGIAYSDEHDVTTYSTCLRSEQIAYMERSGRWDEVVDLATQLLQKQRPSPATQLCTQLRLAIVRARRGEPQEDLLDDVVGLADRTGEPQQQVPARLARAEAYWLAGLAVQAQREAERADDVCADSGSWNRGAVAAWLVRTGSARPVRGDLAYPYQMLIDGEPERAADAWEQLGLPYEAALALIDGPDEAALRRALAILTGLGADAAAGVARRRLRALGARAIPAGPRSSTRAHPWGLTRREREVLELIQAEHTNAEIAGKLFISVKTVDHHVSSILGKLRAPTRAAAARIAAER